MDETKVVTVRTKTKELLSSSIQFPMLNATNYTVWAMRMKVTLKIHKAWETIDPGTDQEDKNDVATALLFQSIPENLILQIGDQDSAKGIWEAIKSRHLGAERVKEARLQTLNADFDRLVMRETDSIDDFTGKLFELSSRSAALGETIEEAKLVKKFLKSLPRQRYIQIIAALEQVLDLNTVGFEDVVGRLKAYEERISEETYTNDQSRLLFTNEEDEGWSGGNNYRGRGRRGRGRGRGRERFNDQPRSDETTDQGQYKEKPKKDKSKVVCFRCDKPGHYASTCPDRVGGRQEANITETIEADSALFTHEVVFLNEEDLRPKKYEVEKLEEDVWYLDNGASNHMTGNKTFFSELNERVTGKVRFGDGSHVDIKGKRSILLQGKSGGQILLGGIYYIPSLKTNILSLGQATEDKCEIKMKGNNLTMHDPNGRMIMRVVRNPNRLYMIKFKEMRRLVGV